jgi:hypothetical protein
MAATLLLYWVGLGGPYLLDDDLSLRNLQAWYQGQADWQHMLFGSGAGNFGRPLASASFALNLWLLGDTPFSFKLGNLLLHLMCGAVVHMLVRRLARIDARMSDHADWLAFGVASVWLLHPFNASTVLYVVQRMAQLSTLFLLLGMWAFLGLRSKLARERSRGAQLGLFVGIPALAIIGSLGKENALLLPALCLVLELTCFRAHSRPRSIWLFFLVVCVLPTLGGLGFLLARPSGSFAAYAARDFSLWERLLSETRVLCDYLYKIVLPDPSRMGVYFDDFPVSTGLFSPPTTALAILVLSAISFIVWRLRKTLPALITGWGIFLVGHAMESTVIPLELYFEHRNYFPMVGVLYALGGLLTAAVLRMRQAGLRPGPVGVIAGTAALLVLGFSVHGRARVWSSPDTIAQSAVAARPESFRANMLLVREAVAVKDRASIDAANGRMFLAANPRTRAYAHLNRVNIGCMLNGAGDPADLRAALANFPPRVSQSDWSIFRLLNRNFSDCQGIDDRAMADTLDAIVDRAVSQPDALRHKFQLRYLIARFYARAGDWPAALEQAKLAWQPGAEAATAEILVLAQLNTNDVEGAERTWREASARASVHDHEDTAGLAWLRSEIDAQRAKAESPATGDTAE